MSVTPNEDIAADRPQPFPSDPTAAGPDPGQSETYNQLEPGAPKPDPAIHPEWGRLLTYDEAHSRFNAAAAFHPLLEELIPPLDNSDFYALLNNMGNVGLLAPIVREERGGLVVDGRARWLACMMLGIEPHFVDSHVGSIVEEIHSRNVMRRHLTQSQRAMIASEMEPHFKEAARRRMEAGAIVHQGPKGKAAEIAASLWHVSTRLVQYANHVRDRGTPELRKRVRDGWLTISQALAEIGIDRNSEIPVRPGDSTIEERRQHPSGNFMPGPRLITSTLEDVDAFWPWIRPKLVELLRRHGPIENLGITFDKPVLKFERTADYRFRTPEDEYEFNQVLRRFHQRAVGDHVYFHAIPDEVLCDECAEKAVSNGTPGES